MAWQCRPPLRSLRVGTRSPHTTAATGTHSITANYSGDSNNAASNATAISLAIAPTTVVATSLFTADTAWETVTVVYSSSAALGTNIGDISVTGPNSQSAYSFPKTS